MALLMPPPERHRAVRVSPWKFLPQRLRRRLQRAVVAFRLGGALVALRGPLVVGGPRDRRGEPSVSPRVAAVDLRELVRQHPHCCTRTGSATERGRNDGLLRMRRP